MIKELIKESEPISKHRWTEEEKAYLASNYDGTGKSAIAIAVKLGVKIICVRGKIQGLKLAKIHRRQWSEDELGYLADHIGLVSDGKLCRHLNRSKNALKIAAYRKLHGMNKRSNIFTARSLAEELGIS